MWTSFFAQIAMYIAVLNVAGFVMMGIDKMKAKCHMWRIPEKMLFTVSILGGSVGTWLGMYVFHHKTRHWKFVIGMPAILVIQILLVGRFFFHIGM